MKNLLFTMLFLFCLASVSIAQMSGQDGKAVGAIDTRGLDRYIEIAEIIQKGEKPSEQLWNSLFETPYFSLAINKVKFTTAEKVKEEMTLVYQPNGKLTAEQTKQFAHQLAYKAKLAELKTYSVMLKDGSVKTVIQQYLNPYLPKRLQSNDLIPPIVYTYFYAEEANGLEDMILQDALLTYKLDGYKKGVLTAHEAFHSVVTKALLKRAKSDVPPTDERYLLTIALSGIAQEGVADLIDKEIFAQKDSPMFDFVTGTLMKDETVNSVKYIKALDAALTELSGGQKMGNPREFRQKISGNAGHQPGRYMAKAVRDAGMLKDLIKDVENPFAFIYVYNKAAAQSKAGHPVLSEKSIAYLKKIESEMLTPVK